MERKYETVKEKSRKTRTRSKSHGCQGSSTASSVQSSQQSSSVEPREPPQDQGFPGVTPFVFSPSYHIPRRSSKSRQAEATPPSTITAMEVDPPPVVTFAGMDARLLLSCVESIAGTDTNPHHRAPPTPHMTMQHHLPVDEPYTGHVPPPSLGTRCMTPLEICHNYATGKFDVIDVPRSQDVESTSNAVPVEQRCALRLVQALTIATNFDTTFSLQQLASRDFCMVDAFLRDDYFVNIRDMIVGDATLPTPSQIIYPSLKHLPIVAIVQSF
ncbi:hypothetical protein Aduo_011788 [Ancylostoma duodenale]